ncbi:MAG: DegV family protein [Dehalococcoidia bacterium]|jgi:DegV family protein with EDD domain
MAVKIVTDSGSDIPKEVAEELGITIVPLYVRFGDVSYRDGVDIQPDKFFEMLKQDSVFPTTSTASPGDFAEVYKKLCPGSDGIISIHLSSKVSATFEAALRGRQLVQDMKCPIEVVDSRLVTIALGLLGMAAARAAQAGKDMHEVREQINQLIPAIQAYGVLDTLKYIAKGGRLGPAVSKLGSVLPVKPILNIKDGVIAPVGLARTRAKGIESLLDRIRSVRNVEEVGISHSTSEDELGSFIEKLKAILPNIKPPTISKLGPALGAHGGPGAILVAMRQELGKTDADLGAGKKQMSLPSMQSIRDGIMQHLPKDTGHPFIYQSQAAQV